MPTRQDIDIQIVKQTRRGIIDALNMAYPAALDYETICACFLDLDERYIQRDLEYLIGRGFVEWPNARPNARSRSGPRKGR